MNEGAILVHLAFTDSTGRFPNSRIFFQGTLYLLGRNTGHAIILEDPQATSVSIYLVHGDRF